MRCKKDKAPEYTEVKFVWAQAEIYCKHIILLLVMFCPFTGSFRRCPVYMTEQQHVAG